MKYINKNILIFGATAQTAADLINKLIDAKNQIYAVSRKELSINAPNLHKFSADLSKEADINNFFEKINGIEFDAVINFQGVAISSPVENLDASELQKQLNISLFSLLCILKNLKNRLNSNSKIISLSSMAAFGLFPFIAPYEISKASSDILLASYELETGCKTVSVKPGVIGTKFWKFCIEENKENFDKFTDNYQKIGDFLKKNAEKNSNSGLSPENVSKLIFKILCTKNPRASYVIGKDAKLISLLSHFKGRFLYSIIRKALSLRVTRYSNDK